MKAPRAVYSCVYAKHYRVAQESNPPENHQYIELNRIKAAFDDISFPPYESANQTL